MSEINSAKCSSDFMLFSLNEYEKKRQIQYMIT